MVSILEQVSEYLQRARDFLKVVDPELEVEEKYKISDAAQDKIRYKLMWHAQTKCQPLLEAYAKCTQGRAASIVWACREPYFTSNQCVQEYVDLDVIRLVARKWVDAGKPKHPRWKKILQEVDQYMEEKQKSRGQVQKTEQLTSVS